MSIVYRNVKGAPLTWNEMDSNWSSIAGLSFSSVLKNGNTTGTYSIVMGSGTKINAASGGGQLDLRRGFDDTVHISTDAGAYGAEQLQLSPGYVELSTYTSGGDAYIYADRRMDIYGDGRVRLESPDGKIWFNDDSGPFEAKGKNRITGSIVNIFTDKGAPLIGGTDLFGEIQVVGDIAGGKTGHNTAVAYNNAPVFISAKDANCTDITNSVILGGTGQVATANNTVYVPTLQIQEGKMIIGEGAYGYVRIQHPVVMSGVGPSASSETSGIVGEVRVDDDYIYIKSTNGWRRHNNIIFNKISTSDATPTTILLIPTSDPWTGSEIHINRFEIIINGHKPSKFPGDPFLGYSGKITGVFRREFMVATVRIGSDVKEVHSEFTTADISLVISGNNILVQVTGEASTDINWRASAVRLY